MAPSPFSIFLTCALALSANAHSLIMNIDGSNGVSGQGFGVVDGTPRDRNDQSDTTRIRNGRGGVCGVTRAGGTNDVTSNMASAASAGVPAADSDGTVTMTIHQVNGDGAGPFTCEVSADGTGTDFQNMQIVTQVPGRNGRSRARTEDFPLVAKMPAGVSCAGGPDGNACLMRCTQRNGFGGCAAITNAENDADDDEEEEEDDATDTNTANNTTNAKAANTKAKGTNNGGNSAKSANAGNTDSNVNTSGAGNTAGGSNRNAGASDVAARGGAKNTRRGVTRRSPAPAPKIARHDAFARRVARSRIARSAQFDY